MVPQVEGGVPEIGEPECGNDVPDAEEPNPWPAYDHVTSHRRADAFVLDMVAEIERRRGASTESNDVDHVVARSPDSAQVLVRLVDARQFAHAEDSTRNLPEQVEPGPHAGHIEVIGVRS